MVKRRKSDDDAPEMGREFFERAERVANGEAALLAAMRKTRGRQKAPTKRLVSLRLSPDVLELYRGPAGCYADRLLRGRPPLAPLTFTAADLAFDRVRPPRRPVAAANRRLPNARSTRPGT